MYIMWFVNFFVSASITMIVPFLSLYIESLDSSYSNEFVQRWSGYVFGVTFLTAFLISPIWGRIGDRHGYKKILLINGIGIATSILLMGLVQTVYQLFALRLFMGLVTGFISTSMALISAQTEKATAGKTLGTMQMSNVAGGLFGPLMGGFMADSVGFIYTFFLTATVIYVSAIVIIFGVKEQPIRSKEAKRVSYSRKDVLVHIFKQPLLVVTMLLTFITQVGNFSIQPLLALYIHDLHGPVNLAFYAGLAFSATGLGNLLFTRKWGDLGDRIGHDKVLLALLILSSILFIPQAMADSYVMLVLFRFLYGMALGGIIPCTTAYIRIKAPASMQGEVLGYNVSFRFLGNVVGPVIGGIVASHYGIPAVFYVTAGIFLFGALFLWAVRSHGKTKERSV
ncbi:MFS transporter [Bacillus sp. LNXM12-2]|nr:MFS transporter [Bacillus pumilus]MBR0587335.1 multidrug efflux MFS transporter [Bacillus pumilus DW2J2]PRS41662.1 MFS transporter [Bacillus sp. NMCC4]PRS51091.1 MFS transporter [Bacillus sp. LNXM10]PRS52316.1 MFS transporter [Bacillus sp. GBSC66]PRS58810.1 MFS transporter [Bacillus sp. GBSW19]PRS72321.1 MFS transporter [Bacillus sp. NMTD17]PRS79735.1 MFS transporter [Bacillus sp. GBSW2]PRS81211.1 MFS transporter [Bacillus sp. CJCL2]PRS84220.1 MFS transporter [Bacillus sp. YBWC18]PSB70